MANFNKVLLMGNLTRDPQLSYTPTQTAVVDFGLAVNRRWTGQDGAQRDETCFVDCRAFGKQAETFNKYMSKGKPVFVEGRLTYDTWTAQDGSRKSRLRVTVENFQFVGVAEGRPSGAGGHEPVERAAPAEAGGPPPGDPGHPPEDDIPF